MSSGQMEGGRMSRVQKLRVCEKSASCDRVKIAQAGENTLVVIRGKDRRKDRYTGAKGNRESG